jgi:hypothetical protein
MVLTREALLKATDLRRELVTLPGGRGEVWVRELTGTERDKVDILFTRLDEHIKGQGKGGVPNIRAQLAAMACCDEAGNRLFTDRDVPELAKLPGAVLQAVLDAVSRLSGLGKATQQAVEEELGNSEGGQSCNSGTDSPSNGAAQ